MSQNPADRYAQEQFIGNDHLRGRKKLGVSGRLVVLIVLLFVAAGGLAWYAYASRNLDALIAFFSPPAPHVLAPATSPLIVPAPTLQAAAGITWTVRAETVNGQIVYHAPPPVEQWLVRDYEAALAWAKANQFHLDVLRAQAAEYYMAQALADFLQSVSDEQKTNHVTALLQEKLTRPREINFFPDGLAARVISYRDSGTNGTYDLPTQQIQSTSPVPALILVQEMTFDKTNGRWKISRTVMAIDPQTQKVLWTGQP